MSEVDRFLFENEKILFEVHQGFLPLLFGVETLYLTNLRSVKIISPGFFSRRTFMFLPHAVARGQAIGPVWDWTAMLLYGILSFAIISIIFRDFVGVDGVVSNVIGIILAIIVAIITGRKQGFAVFGEPNISIVIKDESKAQEAIIVITRLQDEIFRNRPPVNSSSLLKIQGIKAAGILFIIYLVVSLLGAFIFR